ncbi:MAG: NAD(+) diphosphatase [Pseudomonadota bacterium]
MSYELNFGYAQLSLDRNSNERKDDAWINAQLDKTSTQIVCLHNNQNLLRHPQTNPVACFVPRENADTFLALSRRPVFLGANNDAAFFALDLSQHPIETLAIPQDSEFVDLRHVGLTLAGEHASLLAYARGLTYWHKHNQFCANCGSPSFRTSGGHARQCTDSACGRIIFPRTDPAVIMLVEDMSDPANPRCLLGRNKRFAARMFSTLAGFVDPGETLEQCVEREVFEEAGIRVNNVRYQASQPWPFPSSIMLGFRASALTTDIDIDKDEIEEAYWFSADELRTFGEWGDGNSNKCLPRSDSIARYLVESWLASV